MGELAFTAPSTFVGAPLGSVGDGIVNIFRGKHITGEDTCLLEGGDIDANAVVEIGSVGTLLGDKLSNGVGRGTFAIQAGNGIV